MSLSIDRRLMMRLVGTTVAILFGFTVCYFAMLHIGVSTKQWDFLFYYSGSHLTLNGHAGSVFNPQAIGEFERHLARPMAVRDGGLPYVYPPFLAVALAPIAILPYNAAYLLWLAVNAVLLAISLVILEEYANLGHRTRTLLRAAAVCSLPVTVAMLQGQTSLLLLLALTCSLLALQSGHQALAGALLSFLLIKPAYLAPFVVVLAVSRYWKALVSLFLTTVGLFVLPLPIFGLGGLGNYFHTMMNALSWGSGQVSGFDPHGTRSFEGFVQLLAPGSVASVATVIFAIAILAVLAFFSLRAASIDLPWALAVVSAVLISPHVLIHDLSLLLLPVLVALAHASSGPAHLNALIALGYLGVTVGFGLSYVLPIQLSVVALLSLGTWLVAAVTQQQTFGTPGRTNTRELTAILNCRANSAKPVRGA